LNNISYITTNKLPIDQLDNLVKSIGWGTRGKKSWTTILLKSSFIISAWNNDTIVGIGRIVDDGTMCMIYDVVVHPDYQNIKIGSKIMKQIISKINKTPYQSIGLFAWKENPINISFYKKFGFKQVNNGMKL